MADTLFPVNAVSGSPAYSGRMLRQTGSPAFGGATATRPLGARSGVRPGTSVTTVTATSTTWSCGTFAGVADVEAAAEAGPYQFAFDAIATGAVTAANASYPRSDIIYVQVDDPSESDGSTLPAITRKYVAGVAAAAPTDPTLPVSRAYAIARINVPISGGGSPTVTWIAPYAVAAGGILPVSGVSQYPATAPVGAYLDDPSAGLLRGNGSTWVSTAPKILVRGGVVSTTTSAGGDITVTFATPFTSACTSIVVTDSNIGGGIGPIPFKVVSRSASSAVVRAMNGTSGFAGLVTSINYIAFGD